MLAALPGSFCRLAPHWRGSLYDALPDLSNEFPEKAEYLRTIREGTWRDEHDPFVVHYWHHTWCRAGNMLSRWGHLLHQTDGEIVERRLWKILEGEDARMKAAAEQAGRALAEFAQTGERLVVVVEPGPALVRLAAQVLVGLGREVLCCGAARASRLEALAAKKFGLEARATAEGVRHGPPGVIVAEDDASVALPSPVKENRDGKETLCGPLVVRFIKGLADWKSALHAGLVIGNGAEECVVEGGWLALSTAPVEVDESIWEMQAPSIAGELTLLRRRKPVAFPIPRVVHFDDRRLPCCGTGHHGGRRPAGELSGCPPLSGISPPSFSNRGLRFHFRSPHHCSPGIENFCHVNRLGWHAERGRSISLMTPAISTAP